MAAADFDRACGNTECLGEKVPQSYVRFAVARHRTDAHPQAATMLTDDAILTGARLHLAAQYQNLAFIMPPGATRHQKPITAPAGNLIAFAMPWSRISSTLIARKTRIGDRSRPPSGGNSRRTGAITGSVSWYSSAIAG